MPLVGDRKPFPVAQTRFNERDGQFAPDGKWIAYHSDESGRFEIYIQRFPEPGRKWPVSASGGTHVRWRSDGKELFYVGLNGQLVSVPITTLTDDEHVVFGPAAPLFTRRDFVGTVGASFSPAICRLERRAALSVEYPG